MTPTPTSVGIIGGGPGGLITAYLLQQKSDCPPAVTIFEASSRLGGKVQTGQFSAAPVNYEIGAAELYDYSQLGPDPLREMVDDFGLETFPMGGEAVILDGKVLATEKDLGRVYGPDAAAALRRFSRRARNAISPAEYYESDEKADNADPLMHRSFRSILDRVEHPATRRYLEVAVHSDVATEPHRSTATYGLQNWLMNEDGYMSLYGIRGGNGRLVEELARRVKARKFTGHRATRVTPTVDGRYAIETTSPEGTRLETFDAVVVALPVNWLPTIRWGGERLGRTMSRHHARYDHPAHYLRVSVLFRRPFWRSKVKGSYFMSDAFGGTCVYDESSRGNCGSYGVLGWLIAGEAAATMANMKDEELQGAVLKSLPAEFGDARAEFLEARVHRWIAAVNARPGGRTVLDLDSRHRPDIANHPRFYTVGDYLFDSTLNGAFDSAEWVAEHILDPLPTVSLPDAVVVS